MTKTLRGILTDYGAKCYKLKDTYSTLIKGDKYVQLLSDTEADIKAWLKAECEGMMKSELPLANLIYERISYNQALRDLIERIGK